MTTFHPKKSGRIRQLIQVKLQSPSIPEFSPIVDGSKKCIPVAWIFFYLDFFPISRNYLNFMTEELKDPYRYAFYVFQIAARNIM